MSVSAVRRAQRLRALSLALAAAGLSRAAPAPAQTLPGWGRVALYGQTIRITRDDGLSSSLNQLSAAVTLRSASIEKGGLEYAVDVRGDQYPSGERDDRVAVYDAFVGARTTGGLLGVRAGQMWLNDLGALGSVGGLLAEITTPEPTKLGRFRFGLFGGAEPKSFEAGYVSGVRKGGAYAALDGERGRRHVLGYVMLRDSGLTERSVVTITNFIPGGTKFFLYQAAEVDLTGPGGQGSGGLTYFLVNARYAPVPRFELQANAHRGRSIDARSITQDILNGRPIDAKALNGFLFESVGGRVTVEVVKGVRVYAGYAVDRNNRDEDTSGRFLAGLHAANVLGTGLDVTVSDNRIERSAGPYDSWYASLGRSLGSRVYVSLDASTASSVLRLTGAGGVVVETRPQTRRYGLSGVVNAGRSFSILLTLEQLRDDASREVRALLGLTYRM